jgi:hypothetical protein
MLLEALEILNTGFPKVDVGRPVVLFVLIVDPGAPIAITLL